MRRSTVLRQASLYLAFASTALIMQFSAAAGDPSQDTVRVAAADLEHGRALYQISCDACHNENVHWRDKGLVDSWPALLHQVNRWQRNSNQRWDATDVNDVAAYLNERFYHLPCPPNECAVKKAALPSAARARN